MKPTYIALLGIVKKGWRERESILHAGVIPNKVIHVKLFLDHFRLHKSQEDQELTNPVTPISHNYQHNGSVTLSVAEWRSGTEACWAHNPEV